MTSPHGELRVAGVQHDTIWNDPGANFTHLAPMITAAAAGGADLIVLTEFYSTGFAQEVAANAEDPGGPSTQVLAELAAALGVWLCGSLPERTVGFERPTNRFVLVTPGGAVHRYSKIHPFTYAGEHEHFDAGSEYLTVDVNGVRVTPFVCYDLRFADEFWATAATTDLFVVPANWPESRRLHWQALLQARAIENQAYVMGVNRVGSGGGLDYSGDSRIVDPLGELLATAARTETVISALVSAEHVRTVRERFPFLADRRGGAAR